MVKQTSDPSAGNVSGDNYAGGGSREVSGISVKVKHLEKVVEEAKQSMMDGSQLAPSFDMASNAYNDARRRLREAREQKDKEA